MSKLENLNWLFSYQDGRCFLSKVRFAISNLMTFDRQKYRIIWRSLIFKCQPYHWFRTCKPQRNGAKWMINIENYIASNPQFINSFLKSGISGALNGHYDTDEADVSEWTQEATGTEYFTHNPPATSGFSMDNYHYLTDKYVQSLIHCRTE